MLRIYPVVLELVRLLSPYWAVLRARSGSLGDPFERALVSVPLNVAEGRCREAAGSFDPSRVTY
jgi:hypothetical protein